VRKEVVLTAIQQILDWYLETLDTDYTLPLIKKGHVDDIEILKVDCRYDSRLDNIDQEKNTFKTECRLSLGYWKTAHDIIFVPIIAPKPVIKSSSKDDLANKKGNPKTNKLAKAAVSMNSATSSALNLYDSTASGPKDSKNDRQTSSLYLDEDNNANGVEDLIEDSDRDDDGIKDYQEGLTAAFFNDLYRGDCPSMQKDVLFIKVEGAINSFETKSLVLDAGFLRIFAKDSKSMPFGSNIIGGLCLFGYSVVPYDALTYEQLIKQAKSKSVQALAEVRTKGPSRDGFGFSLIPHGSALEPSKNCILHMM
jgi:hypothetical protein